MSSEIHGQLEHTQLTTSFQEIHNSSHSSDVNLKEPSESPSVLPENSQSAATTKRVKNGLVRRKLSQL